MPIAALFFSETTLQFALLGLATGALYALVSLGIVVTYRASGVLNFATGALGAFAAFLFYSLRDDHGVPWVAALVVALIVGAAIGLVTQLIVMTLLRKTSPLAKLIATLGLMAVGQGLIQIIFSPEEIVQPDSILPTKLVKLTGQIVIPADRLLLIGGALIVAIGLRLFYSRSTFGLATSAVAENRRVAASSGWSPALVERVNFALAGVLSAAAAILLAPIVGLDATVLTLVMLPALAAALVGRFSSFPITVGAALAIGILATELGFFQTDIEQALGVAPSALGALPSVVPLLIIVLATTLRGRARLQRGEVLTRLPLPGDGRIPLGLLLAGGAAGMVAMFAASPDWQAALLITFAVGILVLSVVVVTGYAGQLSLAQFALAGFGAWVAARLAATQGFPFEAAMAVGIVLAIPMGFLVALPALRTRGVNLAVATLALAQMMYAMVFSNGELTGGFLGTNVPAPSIFGLNIDPIVYPERYGAFTLIAFVLVGVMVANLRRGRAGRRLLAVRANERAAASLGVGVYGAKLYAFGVASAIAALAGILIGFQNPNVQFTQFDIFGSINAVLFAVVGGVGWASGSVIGAALAPGASAGWLTHELAPSITNLTSWLLISSGVIVFLILRMAPDGLAALLSARWRQLTARARLRVPKPAAGTQEPARVRPPVALTVSDLTVRFGGVVALDGVTFTVNPGEIVGMIGPNGAGKTTVLDIVTGFTKQSSGSVLLDGAPIDAWSAERRARRGLARSWQAVELFEEMTIQENLLVAADRQQVGRYFTDLVRPGRLSGSEALEEVVREFELEPHLESRPSMLSHGTARLVGIARAMVTQPSVLLLDEPAAGLGSHEREELGGAIQAMSQSRGFGILVIEHDLDLLLSICDRIVVLDFGRKIAEGTPDQVRSDPAVIAAYLGQEKSPGKGAGIAGRSAP